MYVSSVNLVFSDLPSFEAGDNSLLERFCLHATWNVLVGGVQVGEDLHHLCLVREIIMQC